MQRYTDVLRDVSGQAVESATVNVYDAATGSLAQLYDGDGNTVGQPLTTDASGTIDNGAAGEAGIGFKAPGGRYRIVATIGAESATLPDILLGDWSHDAYAVADFSSDADLTLTTAQRQAVIELTDSVTVLTAARNVIVPSAEDAWLVINSTAQTLTIKTLAGTGVSIPAGGHAHAYCDGTDVNAEAVVSSFGATLGSSSGAAAALNMLDAEGASRTSPRAVTHNMASDADYTLSATQESYGRIIITDTGTVLTAARNIICSTTERQYIVSNLTAQTLTIKTSAGTGVPVAAGTERVVYCDGTNVERLTYPVLDEDAMTSDSDEAVPTQQSVKAFVESSGILQLYESSEQTITAAGSLTLAHGLSSTPKLIQAHLVCKTAESNYSVGDEVIMHVAGFASASVDDYGMSIVPDSSNINIRYGSRANVFYVTDKTTGAISAITAANWKMVVRAWA